jgi:hypothetical protein
VISKLLAKIRSLFNDGGASERMSERRAEELEEAEELEPGRERQAGQIGMFS